MAQDFAGANARVPDFSLFWRTALNPHNDRSLRVPFYFTSTYRQSLNKAGVSLLVNPSTVDFQQDKRITTRDTQAGRVFYHWTDDGGRNNDVMELGFTGQTGNIDLRKDKVAGGSFGSLFEGSKPLEKFNELAKSTTSGEPDNPISVVLRSKGYTASGAAKLINFMDLFSLTREPMRDPETNAPVYYFVSMAAPSFGSTYITFIGHFNTPLVFTEDASSPFSKQYNFGFTVLSSYPSIDNIYSYVSNNLQQIFLNV